MAKGIKGGSGELEKYEQRIETVKHLIGVWQKFYQVLVSAFDPNAQLDQIEPEFQKVKQIIAERHDVLMANVTHDHYVAQNILNMMRRAITLSTFRTLSEIESRKTLIDWHDANILLYETLGNLTYGRDQLERQKELGLSAVEDKVKTNKLKSMLTSTWFRNLITWVVILIFVGAFIAVWPAIEETDFYKENLTFLHGMVDFIKSLFGAGSDSAPRGR